MTISRATGRSPSVFLDNSRNYRIICINYVINILEIFVCLIACV
jgi:hypothetical protein